MKEIQPITKELLDSLTQVERYKAIDRYQEWVRKVRKKERRLLNCETSRIYRFTHPRKILFEVGLHTEGYYTVDYVVYVRKDGEVMEYW